MDIVPNAGMHKAVFLLASNVPFNHGSQTQCALRGVATTWTT